MKIRHEDAHKAASMYYLQGQTMETIARHLRISRSSVSRLLAYAREVGLVRITVAAAPGSRNTLAGLLSQKFGINAWVVPVHEGTTEVRRLEQVARVAGERMLQLLDEGGVLGVAWGTTISEVVRHLPNHPIRNTTVVQLNGAASFNTTGLPYAGSILGQAAESIGAQVVPFPVPAFFDYADTKRALWREGAIRRVLVEQARTSVALFSVGSFEGDVPSHVYASGYLHEDEIRALREDNVVGDVCTVLLREDGSYRDIELNSRASGPSPAELQNIPTRLCVVAGPAKVVPLLGALRARVATDLVIDDTTARALLERVEGRPLRGVQ